MKFGTNRQLMQMISRQLEKGLVSAEFPRHLFELARRVKDLSTQPRPHQKRRYEEMHLLLQAASARGFTPPCSEPLPPPTPRTKGTPPRSPKPIHLPTLEDGGCSPQPRILFTGAFESNRSRH